MLLIAGFKGASKIIILRSAGLITRLLDFVVNSAQHKNSVPALCHQCDLMFPSPLDLGNSRHVAVIGLGTRCPRCGGVAKILDSYTDSEGRMHVKDLFDYIQNYQNPQKLVKLKSNLEAANDNVTAVELADTLSEIEPGFKKFSALICSLPRSTVLNLIPILISLITLVVTLKIWGEDSEAHEERMEVEHSQLEVAREQLEYQKKIYLKNEEKMTQAAPDKESLQTQIEKLKSDFEGKLAESLQHKPTQMHQSSAKRIPGLKGNQRNKQCPCGSGEKAKKCHPSGLQ